MAFNASLQIPPISLPYLVWQHHWPRRSALHSRQHHWPRRDSSKCRSLTFRVRWMGYQTNRDLWIPHCALSETWTRIVTQIFVSATSLWLQLQIRYVSRTNNNMVVFISGKSTITFSCTCVPNTGRLIPSNSQAQRPAEEALTKWMHMHLNSQFNSYFG